MAKAIEKVVAFQSCDHVHDNNLNEIFQSAYKVHHSTETALIRVQNDVLQALDNNNSVILLLLDLSAAFDTIDHQILLSRLSNRFGFKESVLTWFTSYLSDRKQFVSVNGCVSTIRDLLFGIPQGSVLGPMLFLLYTSPLADVIRCHGMDFHLYADDSQVYISFKSSDADLARAKIEACVRDIDCWMSRNMLKLNRSKTELVVLNARHRPMPPITKVYVCDESIEPTTNVKDIGVIFDSGMSMEPQVNAVCKSSFYHLRNISRIRKYISKQSAETLVHAFVTSKLDFCNSLLYGLTQQVTQKLQSVQNAAARLLNLSSKYDHITPVLRDLHWLPVEQRIKFKIILLTFKCLNNAAPAYLKDLVQPYQPKRLLRSCTKNLLKVVPYKLKHYGYRSFAVSAPRLWNTLPDKIRDQTLPIESFKKHLKTHLFREAYF